MASANIRTARGEEGGTRRRADEVNDRPAAAKGYGSRANVELIYWTVALRADIALLALQCMTEHARTAVFRHDPRPIDPRRPVTHVLIVAHSSSATQSCSSSKRKPVIFWCLCGCRLRFCFSRAVCVSCCLF